MKFVHNFFQIHKGWLKTAFLDASGKKKFFFFFSICLVWHFKGGKTLNSVRQSKRCWDLLDLNKLSTDIYPKYFYREHQFLPQDFIGSPLAVISIGPMWYSVGWKIIFQIVISICLLSQKEVETHPSLKNNISRFYEKKLPSFGDNISHALIKGDLRDFYERKTCEASMSRPSRPLLQKFLLGYFCVKRYWVSGNLTEL